MNSVDQLHFVGEATVDQRELLLRAIDDTQFKLFLTVSVAVNGSFIPPAFCAITRRDRLLRSTTTSKFHYIELNCFFPARAPKKHARAKY